MKNEECFVIPTTMKVKEMGWCRIYRDTSEILGIEDM